MPPRLNKRQLREQEELRALEMAKEEEDAGSESGSDTQAPGVPTGAGFAALMTPLESDEGSDEEIAPRALKSKKKKKKKKPTSTALPTAIPEVEHHDAKLPQDQPSSSAAPSKKAKKALKKQKAKEKRDDKDDVDKALAELSIKYPDLKQIVSSNSASPAARSASNSLASLLVASLQYLDSEAEMRKFFGAKVISASKSSTAGSSSSPRRAVTQRSNLTRPQASWWPAQMREGLSVRLLTNDENEKMLAHHGWQSLPGERVWTVEYAKKYRGVTLAFIQTVMSGDPDGFWQILRLLPYHADTLLQLSEVYFHREEHSTAADYIDRALFTYERAFVGSFNFTSGVNRLDFDRVENRPFFLALHRQVSDLQRRGCVRTAFEFARLLYSLDPWTDPHGALLHLDYLAIRSGMGQWLLDVWDFFSMHEDESKGFAGRLRVTVLPGWAYARALAMYLSEETKGAKDHVKSTKALQEAILAFPSVVPLLADKADISLPPDARGRPAFRIYTDSDSLHTESSAILHLLSHLYAQRSAALWKIPERASWFTQTVLATMSSLSPSYENTTPSYQAFVALFKKPELQYSVYRHVIVLEASCRRLFSFVPRHVTGAKHLACDPLPPPTRVNEYNADFFKGAEDALSARPRGRKANERMLMRLVPDPVFRRQLQAFFEANPNFAQRFPGGILQFAQFAGQLPEEALEDLMIAEVAGQQGEGGMPGQMPGLDVNFLDDEDARDDHGPIGNNRDDEHDEESEDEDEDEADDEEETEDVAPLPVRLLRNVMNRLWGGAAAAEETSDEDEDVPHPDDGVD